MASSEVITGESTSVSNGTGDTTLAQAPENKNLSDTAPSITTPSSTPSSTIVTINTHHKRSREPKQPVVPEEPTTKRVRKPNTLYLIGYEQDKKTEHINKTLFGDGSRESMSSSKESKKESNHKRKREKKDKELSLSTSSETTEKSEVTHTIATPVVPPIVTPAVPVTPKNTTTTTIVQITSTDSKDGTKIKISRKKEIILTPEQAKHKRLPKGYALEIIGPLSGVPVPTQASPAPVTPTNPSDMENGANKRGRRKKAAYSNPMSPEYKPKKEDNKIGDGDEEFGSKPPSKKKKKVNLVGRKRKSWILLNQALQ